MNTRTSFLLLSLLILTASVAVPRPMAAQIPGTISYQGQVDGISGSVDLVFRLYSSAIGGTVLWSEAHAEVPLSSSKTFSIDLGSTTSLAGLPFDRPYYLEVVVEGNIMTPRTPITAAPYARRAATANGLATGALRPDAIASGGNLPADGEVLAFDAPSGLFRWRPLGSGGGSIDRLAEGDGIRIDDLLGPVPTIHIRANGVVGAMIADTTITDRSLRSGAISGRAIADSSLTMKKFAPGVGLPTVGTAGGDLTGNFPNPTIRDSGVRTSALATGAVTTPKIATGAVISDHIVNGTIMQEDINTAAELTVAGVETSKFLRTPVLEAFGKKNSSQTRVVLIRGVANTSATTPLEVVDSGGAPLLKVQDNQTVGIGLSTPSAALEIVAKNNGGAGLKVTGGSTALSFGAVPAGPTITIPAGVTIVRVNNDNAPGLPNTVTMPAANSQGELLIIINSDADALTMPGGLAAVAGGTTGMFVSAGGAGWLRIN